jgi:hypothetical protein
MRKLVFLMVIALSAASTVSAQDNPEAHLQAGIVSQTYWRGSKLGNIGLQTSASLNYKGAEVGFWGTTGVNSDDKKMIDLSLEYRRWGFNVGVIDHWFSGIDENDRYLYYSEKKTGHAFEGNIGYDCRYFSLQAYTMFWGNDFKANGDRAYSTYLELNVPFRFAGLRWDVTAGGTPFESAGDITYTIDDDFNLQIKDKSYRYADNATCVNASIKATKDFRIGRRIILPVSAQFLTNPYDQTAAVILGTSIKL